jgi:hypothetical protein
MTSGSDNANAAEPEGEVEKALDPGEGTQISDKLKEALTALGFAPEQQADLIRGEPTAFVFPSADEGLIGVAQYIAHRRRLRIGIYTINNPGGGLMDFLAFETRSHAAAIALSAREVELLGIEVTNAKLLEVLERGGFTPTFILVAEVLGGGSAKAVSTVFPVN